MVFDLTALNLEATIWMMIESVHLISPHPKLYYTVFISHNETDV